MAGGTESEGSNGELGSDYFRPLSSTGSRSLGSGVDQKAHWKVRRGREWGTFEELPRDGSPGNPKATGREETDASRVGPRCTQGGRAPGAPVQAKKKVPMSE